MSPKVRWSLLAVAALALLAAALDDAGVFEGPPAPIVVTPELVAAGQRVYEARCHSCHRDVPLARRVAGWDPMRAYDVIGRLQTLGKEGKRPMPAFPGTRDERRALAAWISELGAGRASAD